METVIIAILTFIIGAQVCVIVYALYQYRREQKMIDRQTEEYQIKNQRKREKEGNGLC